MHEDKPFPEYIAKLSDIINSSFALGQVYSDARTMHKILRSLPEIFQTKITSLEDRKDLDNMKVEELVGSLTTYKLKLKPNRRTR